MKNVRTAAALGLFDGVHLGHRAVLAAAAEQKARGLVPCAFTFPPESTAEKGAAGYIYSSSEKSFIMTERCGIERIFSPPFADVCGMDGDTFAREVLRGEMRAEFVCCGNDFRFGRGASCGIAELRGFGAEYGFEVLAVDDVLCGGERVSSTLIRSLLEKGETERANEFLGEPYIIMKKVSRGAQLGRTIGFPTANQIFDRGQLVPRYGVYASAAVVDGKRYPSVTDIGMKPTVDYGGAPLAETYIHGFSGDLYGSPLRVELIGFIRPEMRFGSIEELKAQIKEDMKSALNIL
ncbi:riboflavin biosynthesis protein RibF [uncultured Ruminococcus sp.]|uniref:riboflavin biosynthesis protein RibF n=1 Tax=uncultured Ruminococcus sp. TaxID=165186 RepID=UPI00260B5D56|nr:riboflavin biosynthesis protein RibF [uncultured Ruminococcus sp.]